MRIARRLVVALGWAVAAVVMAGAAFPALVPADLADRAARAEATLRRAQDLIRRAKDAEGIHSDSAGAPDPSGLIGAEVTPLVTTLGNLEAKRIATNPAWGSVLTLRLAGAGIRRGSVVAAGFSGSFPGIDLAVTAACEALEADLIAVSSVTASSWGANQPGFTWPEIEARLVRTGMIRRASAAVSMGGAGDRALDLEADGRELADRILEKTAADLGAIAIRPGTLQASIDQRFDVYLRAAAGRRIALYVNVGGTEASLGTSPAILRQRSGFLPGVPFDFSSGRGLIARFAERGVPVLTLLNIRALALRWGVPLAGRTRPVPSLSAGAASTASSVR